MINKKINQNRNLLEVRNGLVHADCAGGDDHTLCGVTSETACDEIPYDYDKSEEEFSTEPLMIWTKKKITCPDCILIIRHCCKLGLKALGKEDKDYEEW